MPDDILSVAQAWDGEAVITRFDRPTGTWIFIALHSSALGPASGGTRMKRYPTPADGLRDAMRLGAAMTVKWAAIDFPVGGGKAVLALAEELSPAAREGLLERYGDLLEALRGTFQTGVDMGTTSADMEVVARRTGWVVGTARGERVEMDPSPYTARGVHGGLRVAAAHVFGSPDLAGRSVLVQGLGNVGMSLVDRLREEGARILATDVDPERIDSARQRGAEAVEPSAVYSTECDLFAPCAIGSVLTADTIPQLRCRVVAGSANAQLGEEADARRLHERGILYLPDFVINAGGAMTLGLVDQGVGDPEEIGHRIDGIAGILEEVLEEASRRGEPPLDSALRRVDRVLARARASR
jgi:leucine dehydrogenase